ncbi:MAG: 8-amino-7-oxononanoate synthase [Thainema sp.]
MAAPYAWIEQSLNTIHRANWHRSVQTIESQSGAVVLLEGTPLINFASNDYLGLASDPRLAKAAIAAIKEYGTSSTGSRLLSGQRELHSQIELAIARFKQTEDALVFSSGYLANIGTITALVDHRDLIVSDQYNHSSLRNGAAMSGATVVDYAHCDLTDLKTQLETHRDRSRRCLIITDSVFSMDGDLCPLPGILDLADQFDCMVLVDEAHGTGVLGETGAGCVEHFGCTTRPLIQIGTLSKAMGSLGGYVAASAQVIDWLRNRAPSWIYTTALTPADTAAALMGLKIVQAEPERRSQLWKNVQQFQMGLDQLFKEEAAQNPDAPQRIPSESAIVGLRVKDAETVLSIGHRLKDHGIFAAAVRPPTVPTSRLRFTLMATHTPEHIRYLLEAIACLTQMTNAQLAQ